MRLDELTPQRWKEVRSIASCVLDAEEDERGAALERECRGDTELRRLVLELVYSFSDTDDLLGWTSPLRAAGVGHNSLSAGEMVGAYRIQAEIGVGGMGRVYLASRADGAFSKRVAIKVISVPSPHLEERFRVERNILAQLEHAGIARLYDAGATADGTPYVVMEYVDGRPVDAYCRESGLNLAERLNLFLVICEAVAYAHRRGVLHRDIKPSNILVTGEGIPKLLDFGLAASEYDAPLGALGFTPAYASPEQALGQPAGQLSDVYSLGVVLYQILTRNLPYHLPADAAQTPMAIATSAPRRPSDYAPRLAGDLDSILLKALEKDPSRRYQSVSDFADDIRRYQSDLPVHARRRSVGYRTGKFVRRNSWGMSMAAVALVAAALSAAVFRGRDKVAHTLSVVRITSLRGRETFPSISPDGKRVAFGSLAAGDWDIYIQSKGSEPVNLTAGSGVDNTEPAFSPDGRQIAFRSERDGGGIFIMDAAGGRIHKLSSYGYQPAWSPDGRELAVCTSTFPHGRISLTGSNRRSQIFAISATSGVGRPLTRPTDIVDAVQPSWSPNGRRVAFWGIDPKGEMFLYSSSALGPPAKPAVVVHIQGASVWNPFWSPSARYLYYDSTSGGTMNLWRIAVDPDTGNARSVPARVTIPVTEAGFFSLSRDGRKLAYTQDTESWNIEKARFDSTAMTVGERVPVTEGTNTFIRPSVSDDGEWVLFQTPDRPKNDIYICRTSGGPVRAITHNGNSRFARWIAPDTIGYITTRNGKDLVLSVHPDGTGEKAWTAPLPETIGQAWWLSPEKVMITLLGRKFFIWQHGVESVFKPPTGLNDAFRVFGFSHDKSRFISAIMPRSRRAENPLSIYEFATGKLSPLGVSAFHGVFLRDERFILYETSNRLMVLDLETHQSREIFRAGGDELGGTSISADENWIFYSRSRASADVWLAEMDPPL